VTAAGAPPPSSGAFDATISTIDVRHVTDALIYQSGPMAQASAVVLGSRQASLWPSGTRLRVIVSNEAGERVRALAQAAMDDYASLVDQSITGTAELTGDDMHALAGADVAPFTIAIRVLPGFCSSSAAACASIGPAPTGRNSSLITLATATVSDVTVTHEMGHAYGLNHIFSTSPILRFLMGPSAGSGTFSIAERDAIRSAYALGVRSGTTRDDAVLAGAVLPWSGVTRLTR
jgi:hypothetical protein